MSIDDRRRRVALLINDLTRGGAQVQAVRLALGMQAAGHEVAVATMLPDVGLQASLEAAGIPVTLIHVTPVRAVPALVATVRWLRQYRADVAVAFLFHASVLARIAGRLAGVPLIISSIRSEYFGGRHREYLMRLTDPLGSVTVVNSRIAAESLVRRRIIPAGRAAVVPNLIDAAEYECRLGTAARVRAALGVAPQTFLWLAVGNLRAEKDYPTLLDAMARLVNDTAARDDATVRLVVVGGGRLRDSLEARRDALGLDESVTFLGPRTDIAELLTAADGVVLSSLSEGLPNVLIEALAVGRPVVSTAVGGTPELVVDGENGFLVPPRDPAALADAMRRLITMPPMQRFAMGAAGRVRILRRHAPAPVLAAWNALMDGAAPRTVPAAVAEVGVGSGW